MIAEHSAPPQNHDADFSSCTRSRAARTIVLGRSGHSPRLPTRSSCSCSRLSSLQGSKRMKESAIQLVWRSSDGVMPTSSSRMELNPEARSSINGRSCSSTRLVPSRSASSSSSRLPGSIVGFIRRSASSRMEAWPSRGSRAKARTPTRTRSSKSSLQAPVAFRSVAAEILCSDTSAAQSSPVERNWCLPPVLFAARSRRRHGPPVWTATRSPTTWMPSVPSCARWPRTATAVS